MLSTLICNVSFLYALAPGWCDANFPKLESGLWQITTTHSPPSPDATYARYPNGPSVSYICSNQTTQRDMLKMSMSLLYKSCSKKELGISNGKAFSRAVCKIGDSTASIQGTTTFLGTSKYQSEVETTYEPAHNGDKKRSITNSASFLGPCTPGQKPGDIQLPGGAQTTMRTIFESQQ